MTKEQIDEIAMRVWNESESECDSRTGRMVITEFTHALLAELAKVQEPVGYRYISPDGGWSFSEMKNGDFASPVYSHPVPSVPKGFTAIHLKTGNEYQVIGEAIDATNMHCNQLMVIYQRDEKTFVREAEEFQDKFKAARSE